MYSELLPTVFVPTPVVPVDIGTNLSTLGGFLATGISTALPYAVGLVGAFFAWRIVRKLVHA